jgi:cell division protein ZapB
MRLDPPHPAPHHARMDRAQLIAELLSLSTRLDELTAQARRLGEENRSLRTQQEQLVGERSALLAKNEQARARVEAMIARLKSLEQHT